MRCTASTKRLCTRWIHISVELVINSRYHDGRGNWGDQMTSNSQKPVHENKDFILSALSLLLLSDQASANYMSRPNIPKQQGWHPLT